jgi:molybdenum-dependent DNA-binding transcriptional regulator ModE
MAAVAAPRLHPRDLPEPLRSALIGPRARGRLERLLVIARHRSILAAAQELGLWHATLYQQVDRLERACGGPLVNRRPGPASTATLTPLGLLLCRQADDYLSIRPDSAYRDTRRTVVVKARGQVRSPMDGADLGELAGTTGE